MDLYIECVGKIAYEVSEGMNDGINGFLYLTKKSFLEHCKKTMSEEM